MLVLLHPGGGSATAWSVALPFFAEHFDVIAPDPLAQGGTPDDPEHDTTVHAMRMPYNDAPRWDAVVHSFLDEKPAKPAP